MKRTIACGLLACAPLLPTLSHAAEAAERPFWRPFVSAGYTWGGRTITPVTLTPQGTTTNYKESISAGAGLELSGGLVLHIPNTPFSVRGSIGHHVDGTSGLTGKASFWRTPVEVGLQWHPTERGTLGVGMRHAIRAKFAADGGTCTDDNGNQSRCDVSVWMSGSHGWYVEGEWAVNPNWSLRVQAVHETFTVKPPMERDRYNGDHIGLSSILYFR